MIPGVSSPNFNDIYIVASLKSSTSIAYYQNREFNLIWFHPHIVESEENPL